ncbi:MAG: DUF4263 domain-containing protein [Lachnospiraceae bacterium]|nr:DUF4263 domain-containing protein [Lachnospiraceae bacterium]
MELESPKKKIFKNGRDVRFTQNFNDAYSQVESWKAYLESDGHTGEMKKRLKYLMGDAMYNVPFNIKYVLIYGRNREKDGKEQRIAMLNQKNTGKIIVKTYDSLISEYRSRCNEIYKVILSPWKDDGFVIKRFPVS